MPRSDQKIAIVGLGLIGGSFFKAIREKGLSVAGIDKNDPVEVEDADLLIIALHPGLAIKWLKTYNKKIKPGALVLDVCGVKSALCKAAAELEKDWTFLGGTIANWSFLCFSAFAIVLIALLLRRGH